MTPSKPIQNAVDLGQIHDDWDDDDNLSYVVECDQLTQDQHNHIKELFETQFPDKIWGGMRMSIDGKPGREYIYYLPNTPESQELLRVQKENRELREKARDAPLLAHAKVCHDFGSFLDTCYKTFELKTGGITFMKTVIRQFERCPYCGDDLDQAEVDDD